MKKPVTVNKKRWAMYAAAGAVTAIAGTQTAEAQITHIMVEDGLGDVGTDGSASFDLGETGATLNFSNPPSFYGGFLAGVGVDDANGANGGIAAFLAAPPGQTFNFLYGANLASGATLSTQFFQVQNNVYLRYGSAPGPNTAFLPGEEGFVGFSFFDGDETAFGWARLTFDPGTDNTFTVEEFAFSDNFAPIVVGQIEGPAGDGGGGAPAIPEPSSLGLLALGAVGVLTNRRRKAVA